MADLEARLKRLNLTTHTYVILERLLLLPYEIYVPILNLLLLGKIQWSDLVDKDVLIHQLGNILATVDIQRSKLRDALVLSPTAMGSLLYNVLTGGEMSVKLRNIDMGFIAGNELTDIAMIPTTQGIISVSLDDIVVTPYEIMMHGGEIQAKKFVQQKIFNIFDLGI